MNRRATAFFTALLLFTLASEVFAAGPTLTPQLRIEGGAHTAVITAVDFDMSRNRAVTTSLDKTLRVWQLPGWQLKRVIRVPSDGINEGKLTVVAMSPDGLRIVTGGWTCWDWYREGCLYVFDAASGEMIQRVRLPAIPTTLSYSEDGRMLAVGMDGNAGIHFLDGVDYHLLKKDSEYGGRTTFAGFSLADNTIVTASQDGYVRGYDTSMQLVLRQRLPKRQHIGAVNLSPDNKHLVIGFTDSPQALVLSFPGMVVRKVLDASDIPGQADLCCVAWSLDGSRLQGYGRNEAVSGSPIFSWDGKRFDSRSQTQVASQRVEAMFTMKGGELLYVTEGPAMGVIDAAGQRRAYIESPIFAFRGGQALFQVSDNGDEVQVPKGSQVDSSRFSISKLGFTDQRANSTHVSAASKANSRLDLRIVENKAGGSLNGKPLPIEENEIVRSYAFTRDGTGVILATEWRLHLLDATGRARWSRDAPGVVWCVNVSGDGHFVLAAYGDGTVRWHRRDTGEEVAALFLHRNEKDWVLWRPDGYYASSVNGDRYVGWHINRGADLLPDFYLAQQFERLFYRPDLLRDVLTENVSGTKPRDGFSIARLDEIAPPDVRINSWHRIDGAQGPAMEIDVRVKSRNQPAEEISVYIDGIPVLPAGERPVRQSGTFTRRIVLPWPSPLATIRVEVSSFQAVGLAEEQIAAPTSVHMPVKKGTLHLVAVGINRFPGLDPKGGANLDFASEDARAFVEALTRNSSGQYDKVAVHLLDENSSQVPTRANVLAALREVRQSGPDDTVIVFLASHGFSDPAGNYYFVPKDAQGAEAKAAAAGQLKPSEIRTLVLWQEVFDSMRAAAGRRFLIVDTCQAQGIEGNFDAHTLAKRSASSLFALFVASQAEEQAQEYAEGNHGLFTFALLEALTGKADTDNDGKVTMQEAFEYVRSRVEKLRDPRKPQTPGFNAPDVLRNVQFKKTVS